MRDAVAFARSPTRRLGLPRAVNLIAEKPVPCVESEIGEITMGYGLVVYGIL